MRYSDSKERSAELLRAALKFMGLHDAAFNPITFSVWYEHAAGSNARLDAAISESLATEPRLGDETVIRLFQDFVLEPDSAAVNRIGLQLHEALGSLAAGASRTGDHAGVFQGQLDRLAASLDDNDPKALVESLRRAVADTGDMKSSAQNLQRKVEESTRVIEELRRDLSRARDEALIDSLTGILNRKGFDDRIHALLSHPSSSSENCLVMLDIDHFKRVNDTHGHVMGDRVIQSMGELLRSSVKNPAHCAARYGGEEFALLMPGCSIEDSMAHAAFVRQQIKAMTIRDRRKDGPSISVTVSLGVTALRSGDDAARFIARADSALYKSKNDGRDRVTFA